MKIIEAYNPRRSVLVIETDIGLSINFNSGFGESDCIDAEISECRRYAYFIGTNSGLEYASLLIVDIDNLDHLRLEASNVDYIPTDVYLSGDDFTAGDNDDFFDLGTKEQLAVLEQYIS